MLRTWSVVCIGLVPAVIALFYMITPYLQALWRTIEVRLLLIASDCF